MQRPAPRQRKGQKEKAFTTEIIISDLHVLKRHMLGLQNIIKVIHIYYMKEGNYRKYQKGGQK